MPRRKETSSLDHTVRGYFEALYRPHKLRFKQPDTIYKWRLEMDRFDAFLKRPALIVDLNDVTVGDAAEWVMAKTGLGLSVESTRGFLSRIRKLWDFLARKRIVDEFPTIENLRKQKRVPRAWTQSQLCSLWAVLTRWPGHFGDIAASDWLCSLHAVLWATSERIGALLQLRWDNVDLPGGFITLQPDIRKGRQVGRTYRLNAQAIEWLSRIQTPARDLVWPWPYRYGYLWTKYRDVLRCAGLPQGRERMFHCMRKSHASHLEAAGGNATESLGHGDRATTIDSYLDPSIAKRDWPADRLFDLGDDGPRAA